MIKYLLLAVLLTGCSTVVPVTLKFPEAPVNLQQSCDTLSQTDSQQLSELTKTVVINYGKYHDCSNKNQAWQDWYKQQKELYEELSK
jgi:hypothetical protein